MLSFFRGKHGSKFVFGFMGLVLLAMVVTGVGTQGGLGNVGSLMSANGEAVAKIGTAAIDKSEITSIAQNFLTRQREQNPELTMQTLVSEGIIDRIVTEVVSDRALEAFGHSQGMGISKRAVDSQIAEIQAFYGVDGKFDHTKMIQLLGRQNMSEAQFRSDFAREELKRQFLVPLGGGAFFPRGLATAYAAILLEMRDGQIASIPAEAISTVPQRSPAEVAAFYARHHALYMLPERRVIEYALFSKDKFADAARPSEAEIAAAFAKDKAKYAAKDLRRLTQLIVPDEAKARTIYEQVKAGAAIAATAKAAGFEAVTLPAQDRDTYASAASAALADAVFKAERGQATPPMKAALGWYIVKVDRVTHEAGKSLDDVREAIIATLSAAKSEELFANFQNTLSDKASAGGRFDDLAKGAGAQVMTTPLIVASGLSADDRKYRPSPDMAALLKDAFKPDTKTSSEPLISAYGSKKDQIALYHVRAITPAGPIPLEKIRDQVAHDAQNEAASKAARKLADDVITKVNKGMTLQKALDETGLRLPPIQRVSLSQLQVQQQAQQTQQAPPPPVRELFSAALHKARLAEFAQHNGWNIVLLDKKTPGDIGKLPQLVDGVQRSLGRGYGPEIMAQFAYGAQQTMGAKKYAANIKALNATLAGNQGQ